MRCMWCAVCARVCVWYGAADHDESGFSVIPYTFHPSRDRWDRRTVAFPADGSLCALQGPPYLSSIPLLRVRFKIAFMDRVQQLFGAQAIIANGQPMTRSYVRAQLASKWPAAVHFAETSQQGRVKQTHPYTPVAMNRQPQDSADVEPRFNYTAGFRPASNVVPHLDFGVLSMLGNHLVSNASARLDYNLYMAMYLLRPRSHRSEESCNCEVV